MARFTGQASGANPAHPISIAPPRGAGGVDMLLLTNVLGASGIGAQAVETEADHASRALDMVVIRSICRPSVAGRRILRTVRPYAVRHIMVNQSKVIHLEANKCCLCDVSKPGSLMGLEGP